MKKYFRFNSIFGLSGLEIFGFGNGDGSEYILSVLDPNTRINI